MQDVQLWQVHNIYQPYVLAMHMFITLIVSGWANGEGHFPQTYLGQGKELFLLCLEDTAQPNNRKTI